MAWKKVVRAWRQRRGVIGMGLVCSLLTCTASTAANALLDPRLETIDGIECLRRLAVGYAAAAAVVVFAFPLLPTTLRGWRWRGRPQAPGDIRPG